MSTIHRKIVLSISRILFQPLHARAGDSHLSCQFESPQRSFLSTRSLGELPRNDCLLEISPRRVYPAKFFTKLAVGSYPTISPLPLTTFSPRGKSDEGRYIFCGTNPPSPLFPLGEKVVRGRVLPGSLIPGVRTFLTFLAKLKYARLSDRTIYYLDYYK